MPLPDEPGRTFPTCVHGYYDTRPAVARSFPGEDHGGQCCPWCNGKPTDGYVHRAEGTPGNGWLLKRGETPCQVCGGPGSAGYGLLPSEDEIRRRFPGDRRSYRELVDVLYKSLDLCYTCGLGGSYGRAAPKGMEGLG